MSLIPLSIRKTISRPEIRLTGLDRAEIMTFLLRMDTVGEDRGYPPKYGIHLLCDASKKIGNDSEIRDETAGEGQRKEQQNAREGR